MKHLESDTVKPSKTVVRLFVSIAIAMMLLSGAALMARPVAAQTAAMPRTAVVELLGDRYSEQSVGLGIAQNGGVIELFTSKDGTTWTMVLTMPNGMSQMIATGKYWMQITPLDGELS